MYKSFIKSGYKDGRTNLKPDEAINRFLDMYEEIPINLPSRKTQKEREEKNYQVPYLSIFSEKTVKELELSKNIAQPQSSITLCAIVEIARNSVLEFEYEDFFDVSPKILADKSAGKGIRQSKTKEITITCKKDLDSNKEIKIYAYPQDRKYKRSLAGKIIVLKNDEKARKNLNIALVNVETKIQQTQPATTGKIEPEEINNLRKALYQCLIVPKIVSSPKNLDLTGNTFFKIIDENGVPKYGKYIFENKLNAEGTKGGIFHMEENGCYDYVRELFIKKNEVFLKKEFYDDKTPHVKNDIFMVFAFGEDSFTTYRSTTKNKSTEGQVKNIGGNTVFLFNGLDSTKRTNDTALAHETLHGLGIYHTHIDDNPIKEPKILVTFEKKATDNYMSYEDVAEKFIEKEIKNTLWRWQWKIANPNIPSIEKDPI